MRQKNKMVSFLLIFIYVVLIALFCSVSILISFGKAEIVYKYLKVFLPTVFVLLVSLVSFDLFNHWKKNKIENYSVFELGSGLEEQVADYKIKMLKLRMWVISIIYVCVFVSLIGVLFRRGVALGVLGSIILYFSAIALLGERDKRKIADLVYLGGGRYAWEEIIFRAAHKEFSQNEGFEGFPPLTSPYETLKWITKFRISSSKELESFKKRLSEMKLSKLRGLFLNKVLTYPTSSRLRSKVWARTIKFKELKELGLAEVVRTPSIIEQIKKIYIKNEVRNKVMLKFSLFLTIIFFISLFFSLLEELNQFKQPILNKAFKGKLK